MKNYEEVAKDVLKRSEEVIIKKIKRQRRVMKAISTAAVCLVLVGAAGFGAWMSRQQGSNIVLNAKTDLQPQTAGDSVSDETEPLTSASAVSSAAQSEAAVNPTVEKAFDIAVSYAGYAEWSDGGSNIYLGGLNGFEMEYNRIRRLPIYKFDTLEDLKQFKLDFGGELSMDRGYGEVPSFNDTTDNYDEAFFEENALMLVYVSSGSGSYFGVSSIFCDGRSFCIHVEQIREYVDCDESGWFVTVAVPDSTVASCTEFDAHLTDIVDCPNGHGPVVGGVTMIEHEHLNGHEHEHLNGHGHENEQGHTEPERILCYPTDNYPTSQISN